MFDRILQRTVVHISVENEAPVYLKYIANA